MTSLPTPSATTEIHRGPPLWLVAMLYMILFIVGLSFVVSFTGQPHFPGPWESMDMITAYFTAHSHAVLLCALFQFGAAIPLGLYAASVSSRLQFLGIPAAGPQIALFGGFLAAFNNIASALILTVIARPGIAHSPALLEALYFLGYGFGGPGFSVPMGLLLLGISIPAAFKKLLPAWLIVIGLILAAAGELSWLNLIFPKALFLIPLTRFPSFAWLILAGWMLPKTRTAELP
jgi:hypothetical protein